jgi:hypothetical protein
MHSHFTWVAAGATITLGAIVGQDVTERAERDLEQAFAAAKRSGKPVFAQFQEVPG